MEKEESIDFGRLKDIMLQRKKVVGGIVVGCTAVALVAGLVWPKTYESTTTVQTRMTGSQLASGGAAAAAAALGIGNVSSPTLTYVELMKSNTVLQPIIDDLDWPEDKKKFLTPESFAKSNLKIENTKQTNLIKVTAKGKTPEEAQKISQDVVNNFLDMMTGMNKETQSLLVQFLNERIDQAKQESDDAAKKFAAYQKEHKIYAPETQAKGLIGQLQAYDDAISKMQVQAESGQAQLDTANAKLNEMKAGSQAYNINDNETVQGIRKQIVAKQVELVGLEQKYTENHPSVIAAQDQLSKLQQSLANEVNAVVSSNATSLNPAQAELLKTQAQAQATVATAQASEAAIKSQRDSKQKELGDLPSGVVDYLELERDAKIKNEVYVNLVKQCEQSRVQQAMDSMDIQVVDSANLPFAEKPVWPRPKLMTALGFVIGWLAAIGYSFVAYKKS
ncbi:GumC family protein [Mitsuokella jalaludinii]|uniref:GumC family protein n=1 Tax=Mitsuokella jalaludinii TaxID=187979 RepID=UPI00055B9841|nr:GumC family protein [Mitsuokella jalaludinii]